MNKVVKCANINLYDSYSYAGLPGCGTIPALALSYWREFKQDRALAGIQPQVRTRYLPYETQYF